MSQPADGTSNRYSISAPHRCDAYSGSSVVLVMSALTVSAVPPFPAEYPNPSVLFVSYARSAYQMFPPVSV